MDISQSTQAFAALSQATRLEVFRLLVKAGADGLMAGEIGEKLQVKQNTMSANLSVLLNAGLVKNKREGRTIRYYADMDGVTAMLSFLLEDCCGGQPQLCQPFIQQITCSTDNCNDA